MKLLGIDYGTKKIGLALSDEKGILAFPFKILDNLAIYEIAREIKKICEEKNVGKIDLGQSLDYKGQPNPLMKEIEKFKTLLEKETKLPIIFETEVLTTKQASEFGHPKAESKIHASSAALILQTHLDRMKGRV